MRHRALAAAVACALLAACSGDEGSAEELCSAVRSDPSITTMFDGFDPTDVDGALDRLRAARVALGELRDAAPSELRDDLTVEIEYVQALVEGLGSLEGGDPADALEVVQDVTEDHPDVDDAAAVLEEFSSTTCA